MQQPFQDAQEQAGNANPFASLFSGQQPATDAAATATDNPPTSTASTNEDPQNRTPNTAPLPNPWAGGAGAGAGAAGAGTAGRAAHLTSRSLLEVN